MNPNHPLNPVLKPEDRLKVDLFHAPKHPRSICVANYKGGVGKTTITCLLGYYIALETQKRVLLFDIDPQCSLSLALGFDPEQVNKTELTIYNLVKPSKWANIKKTDFEQYVFHVPDTLAPNGLRIVRGSFEVEELDFEIVKSLVGEKARRVDELFLYCKQMMISFEKYDYIIVDCPPNKMYLTQALLRACQFFLPVTIPDAISIYGMPRLLRWVKQIPLGDRPLLLGYVLNAVNRIGGASHGVVSQQAASRNLENSIQTDLGTLERQIIGQGPEVGVVPRLDAIARFLSEQGTKFSRHDFSRRTSGQSTIDQCMKSIAKEILRRLEAYHAAISG